MDVLVDNEIVLYGTVGEDFFMDGFTAGNVSDALAKVGRAADVTVRLNSGGGFASEGVAIFNALKAHRGRVTVSVEAMAASAASLIAMAGDDVIMRDGSVMMIHDPSVLVIGNSAELGKGIEYLEAQASGMAEIYAEKSGKSPDEARADMREELWMSASDAVDEGYADRVSNGADIPEPTAFDYRIYQKPPERLVALAAAKGWTIKAGAKAEQSARKPKGKAMSKDNPAGGAPAKDELITASAVAEATAKAKADGMTEGKTDGLKEGAATARADAVEIVGLCTEAGVPAMAKALINEGISVPDAKVRIAQAKDIKEAVALARKSAPAIAEAQADAYITAGTPIEQVRADLFTKMSTLQSAEITSAHQPGTGTGAGELPARAPDATAIYEKRALARTAWLLH